MIDSIALNKVKTWYGYLSSTAKIEFLEYLWKIDKHKMEYASYPDSLRRFYSSEEKRPAKPTHQEGE